jgi:hypothetical protein
MKISKKNMNPLVTIPSPIPVNDNPVTAKEIRTFMAAGLDFFKSCSDCPCKKNTKKGGK